YLESTMRQIGLKQVEIVNAPADGATQVGYWTEPLAWDVKSATLELLDNSLSTDQRTLADYAKVPASLVMWSGPTPKGGVTAEIVAVASSDVGKVDLRGKFALTDVNPSGIKWLLVKAGALGAINTFTENPALLDGRQWINAWGDDGWAYTARSTPLLGFSITPNQAHLVRELLKRGPVRAHATVDTRYYSGPYPYVTGIIRGTSQEEVLTLGHTSEQGAEDNATGVAATLEAMATLQRLIASGKLPQPKRSIRVLSMGEMYGSMHYVEHNRDRIRRTVAAMCVDTPAASYDLAGTEYTFYMNPHVAKDFTDALILKIAGSHLSTVNRPWHEKEFTTGTDTYMAEPMVGVPTVWGYSGSGVETHHNSEDTPDRVDPRSLRDISIIDAAFLYFIANAGESEALWLAQLSESRGYDQVAQRTAPLLDRIASPTHAGQAGPVLADSPEQIGYAVDREAQAIRSVQRLVPEPRRNAIAPTLNAAVARLEAFGQQQRVRIQQAAEDRARDLGEPVVAARSAQVDPDAARIIVRRKRFGTLPLDDLPHDQWEGYPSGAWAAVPTIALYWCDGHRNLAEVIRLTELELGPSKFDFVGYFRFLERHGYVEFAK
ncbi:MAG: M28 family peptidase, partial [Acidobacteriota bacterium]|nr:M28 family peptidase [Acidobacteriota bacterium]